MHVTLPTIFGAYALSMVGSVCAVARDLPEEFKRWIETQCALPNAQTAAILLWVLMESGKLPHTASMVANSLPISDRPTT